MIIISGVISSICAYDKITLKDFSGRTVELKKNPSKVILVRSRDLYTLAALLGDSLPEVLTAWGPDLERYDNDGYKKFTEKYPELATLPEIGDIYSDGIDPEILLSFDADLVILDIYFKSVGPRSCEKMENLGLPIIYLDQSTNPLESPQNGITLLAKIFGVEKRGEEINRYVNGQIQSVLSVIGGHKIPGPSVYIETGNMGPDKMSVTHGGYGKPFKYDGWASMLNGLKVKNIADGLLANGMGQINAEYIFRQDPDIIVITGANWNTPGAMRFGYHTNSDESRRLLEGFTGRPGWNGLSAVRTKKVCGIFHGFVMHIFDFAGFQALAKYFYPDEFENLDPEKNLKIFYERYMPISCSGTWMAGLE